MTAGRTYGGTGGKDLLVGMSGDDLLRGLDGEDFLLGGVGDDVLEGGEDDDSLEGELGDDRLYGGGGDDTLADSIGGSDQFYGGAGQDMIFVYRWFDRGGDAVLLLDGGDDGDFLSLHGWENQDATLLGGDGNDNIIAELGRALTIDGGDGAELDLHRQ